MKPITYSLVDTFNSRHLSSHRTLANALKARQKHAKKWQKWNGAGAFVFYRIIKSDGTFILRDELIDAEIALESLRDAGQVIVFDGGIIISN